MDWYRKALFELEAEQRDDYTYADLCKKLEKPTQLIVDDEVDQDADHPAGLNDTVTTISGEDDDHSSN